MYAEEGLQITLSPVQLAAVLSDDSVSEGETTSNRLWGSGMVLLGALELVAAATLCRIRAKTACIGLAATGSDMVTTGAVQAWTGHETYTATYKTAAALARQLGADEETANNLAKTIDVAVPMAFAGFAGVAGAARVSSIRAGRIKLIEHEAAGGHTIVKHIGKSKEELLYRLKTDPKARYGVSSFTNLNIAEKTISQAIKANKLRIQQWSKTPFDILRLEYTANFKVGYYIRRGSEELVYTSKLRVVLVKKEFQGKPYYILTSFPTW